jgi:hypothetical protein
MAGLARPVRMDFLQLTGILNVFHFMLSPNFTKDNSIIDILLGFLVMLHHRRVGSFLFVCVYLVAHSVGFSIDLVNACCQLSKQKVF